MVAPDANTVWVFCVTALALLLIPGPAVLYVVVQGAEQGRRAGLASVAGIHLGTLVHVFAATVGLCVALSERADWRGIESRDGRGSGRRVSNHFRADEPRSRERQRAAE